MSHFINPQLLDMAKKAAAKQAFVPAGDPAMAGGGAPAPGGDPAAAGGDPAAGGMMPPPPPEGGGGGGMDTGVIADMVVQKLQASGLLGQGGAGGAGAGAGAMKPKIDVNVELMQIKNLLAKLCDAMGVQIPAQDMVATPEKLMAMSQGQNTSVAGGAGGGAPQSSIKPIEPIQGASPQGATKSGSDYLNNGIGHTEGVNLIDVGNKAAALRHKFRAAQLA